MQISLAKVRVIWEISLSLHPYLTNVGYSMGLVFEIRDKNDNEISQNPLVSSSVLLLLQPYITFEEAVFNSLSYEKERSAPRL